MSQVRIHALESFHAALLAQRLAREAEVRRMAKAVEAENKPTNIYPLVKQVKDTIQSLGYASAAKLYKRKIPFTIFYYMAFGKLPTTRIIHNSDKIIKCI
jgi:phage gp29-like protein